MTRVLLALALLLCGCIKAPEIVLVDRATALEQQAGGSYDALEKKLARAGMAPRPVPLSPEQLQSLGIQTQPLVDTEDSEADKVDELLKQRCLGEGKDGVLVDTKESCRGAADRGELEALLQRANEARAQLFRWLEGRRPGVSKDELRKSWRATHLKGVVCGGWIQKDDGTWEAKAC